MKAFAKDKRAHPPAASKAKEAQDAALAPSDDMAGQAKEAKVASMDRIAVEVLVGERQKQAVERPAGDRCRGAALPARRGYDARWHERGDDPGLRLLEELEEPVVAVADVDLRRRAGPRPGGLEPVVRHSQEPARGVLDRGPGGGHLRRRLDRGAGRPLDESLVDRNPCVHDSAGYAVPMAGRASLVRAEPGFSLPFFDRLAPAPPPALVAARLEAHSGPGDIVLDLAGRGGWIAHAAIDRQRRAVSVESSPLSRLLAELVLRPPDLRHLDAAFQAMSASPRRQSSLKVAVGDLFATRCATCERMLVADEFIWPGSADADADRTATATAPAPRMPARRRPASTTAARSAAASAAARSSGRRRSTTTTSSAPARRPRARTSPAAALWDRFPVVEGAEALVDTLLELHTPRQLIGLEAILERIEGDLRAAPIEAALRLALLHALLPASRLNGFPGRIATLRIQGGRVRPPGSGGWRERNPWLAFEDGMRLVRGFIQRLEGGPYGSVQARLGEDLRSLADGTATAVLGVAGPSAARILGVGAAGAADRGASGAGVRVKLRPGAASPAAASGSCSVSLRSGPTRSGSRSPTGRRRGCSAGTRRRSSRSRRCPEARSARHGAGRPPRSAGRWPPSSRRSPATAGSSSSSTRAVPRGSSRRRSAASRPASASSGPGSRTATRSSPGRSS